MLTEASTTACAKLRSLSEAKTNTYKALAIMINGTIGARAIGNKPRDSATTLGSKPIVMACEVPRVIVAISKIALISGPVMAWLGIREGRKMERRRREEKTIVETIESLSIKVTTDFDKFFIKY